VYVLLAVVFVVRTLLDELVVLAVVLEVVLVVLAVVFVFAVVLVAGAALTGGTAGKYLDGTPQYPP